MEKQPAHKNYFFSGSYIEFKNTVKSAFAKCRDDIRSSARLLKSAASDLSVLGDAFAGIFGLFDGNFDFDDIWDSIKAIAVFSFALLKLVFVCVLTTLATGIVSVVHTLFLTIFLGFAYAFFGVVKLIDVIYCTLKKIGTSCPNCQEKYGLPAYVCECGEKHTKLAPSKYGIFKRRCNCDRKLQTSFMNGRHKLPGKWVCPKCGYELGGPLQVDIPIPVIGGPSSGKTCFISMAISEIERKASAEYNLDFAYRPNEALGDDYKFNKSYMEHGQLPQKTSDTRLRYYQFYLTPKGHKVKNLISICDVAGETYSSGMDMGSQVGFKNATAFLVLIDPLSIAKYREEVSRQVDLSRYGASEKPMDEVLNMLISTLENMNCLSSGDMVKIDVAVVFTKCDIPGLEGKIGQEAVRRYMQENDERSRYIAKNKLCEKFLIDYEESNLLNSLKSKFKSVQFFTCSALGHVENGKQFAPANVDEPALWLIDKASASINLKAKWGKKI